MARVLVVDDETGIRESFGEFLRDAGHEVLLASDGMAALRILHGRDIDVVLSDIIMPNFSGMELLEYLHETNDDVQVILLTGQPSVETASAALRDRAFEYLSKPVSGKKVCHTVKMASDFKKLKEEKRRLEGENQRIRRHLEVLIEERTAKLEQTNRELLIEIRDRVKIEDDLKNSLVLLRKHMEESAQVMANIEKCRP